MARINSMSTQQHLTALGSIYIALSALNVIFAMFLLAVMGVEGVFVGNVHDVAEAITSDMRAVLASFSVLAAGLQFIGGVGLLKRKSWSWTLLWALACLSLLSVPIGTVIGVYALWVLTRPEAQQILGGSSNASLMKRAAKILLVLSFVLILASFPACYLAEGVVQSELSKLSPAERELRRFDLVYMRWALPGVLMFLYGIMLAMTAMVTWLLHRRTGGRTHKPETL
jgi:hypothetical protein